MLATNLPILKYNLNDLLNVPPIEEGPVYKAAYAAAYNAKYTEGKRNFENADSAIQNIDDDLKASITSSAEYIKREPDLKDKSDKFAKDFATEFCNSLKNNGFMDSLANEIDKHIKAIGLSVTVLPQGLATIASPAGPCTGTLMINDATAQIQIS